MNFLGDYTMTIDGRAAAGQATFDVLNPATEAVIGSAPIVRRPGLMRP